MDKRNPYTPGAGIYPKRLAGRDGERGTLQAALETIACGDPVKIHVLYGPRGNGKTVLLEDLLREAQRRDTRTLALVGSDTCILAESDTGLPAWKAGLRAFFGRRLRLGAKVGAPGLGEAGVNVEREASEGLRTFVPDSLPEWTKPGAPLLAVLDEAQVVPTEELGDLLRRAQSLHRVGCPLLLALAGTPDLEAHLRGIPRAAQEGMERKGGTRTTFWERSERLGVGLLPEGAVKEILVDTGRDAGLRYAPDALACLDTAANHYPYFAQLLGEAAWNAARAAGTDLVDSAIAETANAKFEAKRDLFYTSRLREIKDARLDKAAYAVAEALVAGGGAIRERELDRTLETAIGTERRAETRDRLAGLGFIWETMPLRWEGGSPSLIESVRSEFAPEPSEEPGT